MEKEDLEKYQFINALSSSCFEQDELDLFDDWYEENYESLIINITQDSDITVGAIINSDGSIEILHIDSGQTDFLYHPRIIKQFKSCQKEELIKRLQARIDALKAED